MENPIKQIGITPRYFYKTFFFSFVENCFYSYNYISTLVFNFTQMKIAHLPRTPPNMSSIKDFAIASEQCDCPCMAEITGLLADSGLTQPQ